MMSKRYTSEEADVILSKLKEKTFEELSLLFEKDSLPLFEEFKGETAGSFLAWNPKTGKWIRLFVWLLFESPIGRWTGKEFITKFDKENKGSGINLFNNKIRPVRYPFDTYFKPAYIDGNLSLALDYTSYPTLMSALIDDTRKIEPGVLLGQMYFKFPWRKNFVFIGYFALVALTKKIISVME